ncbi:hypothetical protein WA158_008024 [Blastocystis sp. Blastoise]
MLSFTISKPLLRANHLCRFASSFRDLGVSDNIMKRLNEKKYRFPTPVQKAVIPMLLEGEKDVVINSESASGKTLAYLLPLVQAKQQNSRNYSIIMTPRPELSIQMNTIIRRLDPDVTLENSNSYFFTKYIHNETPNFLISTPAMFLTQYLKYYNSRRFLENSYITPKYFVIDEVDCVLNQEYGENMKTVLKLLHKTSPNTQFIYSGATIPTNGASTPGGFLTQAFPSLKWYQSSSVNTIPGHVTVDFMNFDVTKCGEEEKKLKLLELIVQNHSQPPVVFFNNTDTLARIYTYLLSQRINCAYISRDITISNRVNLVHLLQKNKFDCLLSTDILSRGIDTPLLTTEIQYEFSNDVSSFINRCGRVGRSSQASHVYCFVDYNHQKLSSSIQEIGVHNNLSSLYSHNRMLARKLKKESSYPYNSYDDQMSK